MAETDRVNDPERDVSGNGTIRRIEDYALLSSLRTAALVHRCGSIDWCCFPRFDAEAVSARLLGHREHGRWLVAPVQPAGVTRRYRSASLILETEWETAEGLCRVIDFMPTEDETPAIVRIVKGISGRVPIHSELMVRFGYGRDVPVLRRAGDSVVATAGRDALSFSTRAPVQVDHTAVVSDFDAVEGDRVALTLAWTSSPNDPRPVFDADVALRRTQRFWDDWASRCTYGGWYRDAVLRSIVVLKGLTYRPTGGIVAAPTTSLPEWPGGVRNWDYRYCWLRDAALTFRALVQAGYLAEADDWRAWLVRTTAGESASPQIMYGVDGERDLTEWQADWLPGFNASRPVRIGNAAADQVQLDVYGEVIEAVYEARRRRLVPSAPAWQLARRVLGLLEDRWRDTDEGIWEIRGEPRHFTHSKTMAWVAFDRGIKMCEEFGLNGPLHRWRAVRDEIHAEVCARAWNSDVGAFTQSYGSDQADASLLQLALVGFLPNADARMRGTMAFVRSELTSNGLLLRYRSDRPTDGLPAGEGAFLLCSFWLVEALALDGHLDEATTLFERLLDVRNDLGLLAEEYDPNTDRLLGNFPQAFSHIALVNAATTLAQTTRQP